MNIVNNASTVGTLVVSALEFGVTNFIRGTVSEAAKDAYKALKTRLGSWAAADVAELELHPSMRARQAVIAEIVDGLSAQDQEELRVLGKTLTAKLREESTIGVDVGRLESLGVQLDSVTANYGVGARFQEAKIQGIFKVGNISVGVPPEKT